jgi:hypothetical protein
MADRHQALEKLMQAVDTLATGAGRAQERLGHGYLEPVTCLTTTWGRGVRLCYELPEAIRGKKSIQA